MPSQIVNLTLPYDGNELDMNAARLQAKKVAVPGATDSHGVTVQDVQSGPGALPSTTLVFLVRY